MTDILFYGDPHGDFRPLIRAVDRNPPTAVVLLGDMEAREPLDQALRPVLEMGVRVHWIPGNHDTDTPGVYDNLYHSGLAAINVHGKIVNIGGIRIGGLGGVFRGKVWDPNGSKTQVRFLSPGDMLASSAQRWRNGLPLRHRSTIFPDAYQGLLGQRADVLITHEAPECHRHGSPVIGRLAGCLYARLIVHGHHHVDYEDTLYGGIDVRGVGLRSLYRLNVETFKSRHGLDL
ncbi:MAG: metallophosphoesterase [Arenibacter algicola]|nr:metallophosphoesterase [Arenibacter algicola]